jgi:hypothetical protein
MVKIDADQSIVVQHNPDASVSAAVERDLDIRPGRPRVRVGRTCPSPVALVGNLGETRFDQLQPTGHVGGLILDDCG